MQALGVKSIDFKSSKTNIIIRYGNKTLGANDK